MTHQHVCIPNHALGVDILRMANLADKIMNIPGQFAGLEHQLSMVVCIRDSPLSRANTRPIITNLGGGTLLSHHGIFALGTLLQAAYLSEIGLVTVNAYPT